MSIALFKKYGDPVDESSMMLWSAPMRLQMGKIPKRIYCNRDLVEPLAKAFDNIVSRKLVDQLDSWDGCFNIRPIRGMEKSFKKNIKSENRFRFLSKHAWGLAVDVNAATNRLGAEPTLSPEFVACFTDAGFKWGGNFKRKDGMHFEL